MTRFRLAGTALAVCLLTSAADAQSTPPMPTMPRPPSFDDPAPAKPKKAGKKPARAAGAARAETDSPSSFERTNRFVPSEFDGENRGRSGGGGAAPMMSGSGRPGMGMRF